MTAPLSLFAPAAVPVIDLRCASVDDLLADLRGEGRAPSLWVADPPWEYDEEPGVASPDLQYRTLSLFQIVDHLDRAYACAARDGRLAVWCTSPWLSPFLLAMAPTRWRFLTAGSWVKTTGSGVGQHWRGRAEYVLLFAKGAPPIDRAAHVVNGYASPALPHSEKPSAWMASWLPRWVPDGGLVGELYAGESAALARACLVDGRVAYVGAEIDGDRHAKALARLAETTA